MLVMCGYDRASPEADERGGGGLVDAADPVEQATPAAQRPGACRVRDRLFDGIFDLFAKTILPPSASGTPAHPRSWSCPSSSSRWGVNAGGRRRCRGDAGAGGGCYLAGGRGRVDGKPGPHLDDRLGLLLLQPAAFLTAHQLHLEGEPGRPGSCPPPSVAAGRAVGGGLARVPVGPRVGVGGAHARLLARLPGAGCARRSPCSRRDKTSGLPWSVAPAPDRVSITLLRVFARLRMRQASVQIRHRGGAGGGA